MKLKKTKKGNVQLEIGFFEAVKLGIGIWIGFAIIKFSMLSILSIFGSWDIMLNIPLPFILPK